MKKFAVEKTTNYDDNPTDRQERIFWWDQDKLRKAKIMVVGAGAIGNETLKNLALLGVGYILIVDFDTIATSNLSRTVLFRKEDVGKKKAKVAAKKLRELAFNDDLKIEWFHGDLVWDLGAGIFEEIDLVLACLDNVEARISINRKCWSTNTPWIDSGMSELGIRVECYHPPQLPCYECNLTPQQLSNSNKRYSCDQTKLKAFEEDKVPTTQIAAAIVAGIQVQEAVKFLCGQTVVKGKKIYYQGLNNDFDIFTKSSNEDCLAHASYPEVIDIDLNINIRLSDFLSFISQDHYSGKNASLDFRSYRTFITKASCRICDSEIHLMRPTFKINTEEFICSKCKRAGKSFADTDRTAPSVKIIQDTFNITNTDDTMKKLTLKELGVPFMPILAVMDEEGNHTYYKINDKSFLKSIH